MPGSKLVPDFNKPNRRIHLNRAEAADIAQHSIKHVCAFSEILLKIQQVRKKSICSQSVVQLVLFFLKEKLGGIRRHFLAGRCRRWFKGDFIAPKATSTKMQMLNKF